MSEIAQLPWTLRSGPSSLPKIGRFGSTTEPSVHTFGVLWKGRDGRESSSERKGIAWLGITKVQTHLSGWKNLVDATYL